MLGMSVDEAFSRPVDKRFQPTKRPVRTGVRTAPPLTRYPDGRACVRRTEGGRRRIRYFGKFGTEAADATYAVFCAEWYANHGRPAPVQVTSESVGGSILRFLAWAEEAPAALAPPASG